MAIDTSVLAARVEITGLDGSAAALKAFADAGGLAEVGIKKVAAASEDAGRAQKSIISDTDKLVQSLNLKNAALTMNNEGLATYKAQLAGASESVIAAVAAAGAQLDATIALNKAWSEAIAMNKAYSAATKNVAEDQALVIKNMAEVTTYTQAEINAINALRNATESSTNSFKVWRLAGADVGVAMNAAALASRDLTAATKAQTTEAQSLQMTQRKAIADTTQLTAATQGIIDKYDPLGVKLRSLKADLASLVSAQKAGVDVPAGILNGLNTEIAKTAKAVEDGHGRMQLATAGTTREFIVLGHEVISGNFSRIPGSLMVLGERMGNLDKVVSALASPTGILVASVLAMGAGFLYAVAYAETLHRTLNTLETQLSATGHSGEISKVQLKAWTDQLALMPGISKAAAVSVVSDFTKIHGASSSTLMSMSLLTADWAASTGKSADAAAKDLAKAIASPLEGIKALDKETGAFKISTILLVEELMKHNNIAGAQKVLYEALAEQIKGVADRGLTPMQIAMKEVATSWQKMTTSMGDSKAIVNANLIITSLVRAFNWVINNAKAVGAALEPGLAALTAYNAAVLKMIPASVLNSGNPLGNRSGVITSLDSETLALGKLSKAQQDNIKILIEQNSHLKSAAQVNSDNQLTITKLKDGMALLESVGEKASTPYKKLQDELTGLNESLDKGVAKKSLQTDLESFKHTADEQVKATDAWFKEIKEMHTAKLISDDNFFAAEMYKIHEDADARIEEYTASITRLQQFHGKTAVLRAENLREIQSYEDKIKAVKSEQKSAEANVGTERIAAENKAYVELANAMQKAGDTENKALDAAIEKQELHNASIGKTKEQIDAYKQARSDLHDLENIAEASTIQAMIAIGELEGKSLDLAVLRLSILDEEIRKSARLHDLQSTGMQGDAQQTALADAKKLAELTASEWKNAGKQIEESLKSAFGAAGAAAAGMVGAYTNNVEQQIKITQELAAKIKLAHGDPIAQAKAEQEANNQRAQAEIKSYGDMASAAQGFFKAGTKGYEAMGAVSKVFHAVELAMALKNFLQKEFFTATEETSAVALSVAKIAAEEQSAAISSTIADEQMMEDMAVAGTGVMAGAGEMFAQSGWGGFAGVAAMLAVMGGLGFSGGSGGGGAIDMSKKPGTGTVLGDSGAQSKSIDDSITTLSTNSNIALKYTQEMLSALNTIRDNIGALTNTISLQTGIRGTTADSAGINTSSSFLGLFGSTTELTGQGLQFGHSQTTQHQGEETEAEGSRIAGMISTTTEFIGQTVDDIRKAGIEVQKFTDITTQSTGLFASLFGSTDPSTHTSYTSADDKMKSQIQGIILGTVDAVIGAATALGGNKSDLTKQLGGATVDLGKLDFKGMTGQQIQDELKAVFGAFGDGLTEQAIPAIKDFERTGEGGLATMARVLTGVESANLALGRLGITAIDYTKIINKQGDVMAEIARQSIHDVEKIVGARGTANAGVTTESGIGKIIDTFVGSGPDLIALYTTLVNLRTEMKSFGAATADVTSEMVAGAGDISTLEAGIKDYYAKAFTSQEQAIAHGKQLNDTFAKFNTTVPANESEFRKLVESIDLTTEAGNTLYGQLMAAHPAFSAFQDEVTKFTENAGISASNIAKTISDALLGKISEADLGKQMSDTIIGGVNNALTNNVSEYITGLINDTLIKPIMQAILEGNFTTATINQALTRQNIQNMVAGASAAVEALKDLFNNQAFKDAIKALQDTIGGIMSTVASGNGYVAPVAAAVSSSNSSASNSSTNTAATAQSELEKLLAETAKFISDLAHIGETQYEAAVRAITEAGVTRLATLNAAGNAALSAEKQAQIAAAEATYHAAIEAAHNTRNTEAMVAAQETYNAALTAAGALTVDNTAAVNAWTQSQIDLLNAQNSIKASAITLDLRHQMQLTGMTAPEQAVASINAQAETYIKSLKDLGQATSDNIAQVREWQQTMLKISAAKDAIATMQSLATQIQNVASLKGSITSNMQSIQATMPGYDNSSYLSGQVANAQTGLSNVSGGTIEEKIAAANTLQSAIMSQYQGELSAANTLHQAQASADQAAIAAANALNASFRKLGDYAKSLLVGASTILNPKDQLEEARKQYETTLAQAQAHDPTAMANLQGSAQTYLDLARAYHASDENYVKIFTAVQSAMAALGAQAGPDQVYQENTAVWQAQLAGIQNHALEQLATLARTTDGWQKELQLRMAEQAQVFVDIGLNTSQMTVLMEGLPTALAQAIAAANKNGGEGIIAIEDKVTLQASNNALVAEVQNLKAAIVDALAIQNKVGIDTAEAVATSNEKATQAQTDAINRVALATASVATDRR